MQHQANSIHSLTESPSNLSHVGW